MGSFQVEVKGWRKEERGAEGIFHGKINRLLVHFPPDSSTAASQSVVCVFFNGYLLSSLCVSVRLCNLSCAMRVVSWLIMLIILIYTVENKIQVKLDLRYL